MYSFNYNVTEQDYLEFHKNHLRNTKEGKRLIWVYRLLVLTMMIAPIPSILDFGFSEPFLTIMDLMIVTIGIILFICANQFTLWCVSRTIKRQQKKGNAKYTPKGLLSFDEEQIIDVCETSEMKVKYSVLEKVYVTPVAFYFYISSIQAFILPYKSFSSQQQLDEFFNFIRNIVGDGKIAYIKK